MRATVGPAIVCFDVFEVNLRTGDVHKNATPIVLQEQPLRILIRLLEAPGEIVLRDDLRAELWPANTFVDFDHSLNTAIKRLRDVLGDSADAPRFVETIPRRGYRFIATVAPAAPDETARIARRRWLPATALTAVLLALLGLWVWPWRSAAPLRRTAAAAPTTAPAIAPAAYDAYLQGLVASRRWQAGGCIEAEKHLLEAISIEPTLADAYAHLGWCYVFPDRIQRPGWETGPMARAAAERALRLDPRSALAHVVEGQIKLRHDFDAPAAEREFLLARELNPADARGAVALGELLYETGRAEAGLRVLRDALRLDPLNMDHQTAYGFALRNLHRFDEAAGHFRRTLENDPGWTNARFWLAYTEADRGRHDEAVAEYLVFLRNVVVPGRAHTVVQDLAETYRRAGWLAFWRAELALAEEDNRSRGSVWRAPASNYSGPFSMARRYARVDDRKAALDWLEQSFTYRHHLMRFIAMEPLFECLHDEPRFLALRRQVGV